MHLFYQKFAEEYIIVKHRSNWILVAIHKILAELWPFFDSSFCCWVKYEKQPCVLHDFDTLNRYILIIFGKDEEEEKVCHVQERQLTLPS